MIPTPLDRGLGIHWCYWFGARLSGCQATAILNIYLLSNTGFMVLLAEAVAGNMLPYIVAAGHNKYGVFLPLFLREMKMLAEVAPSVLRGL